MTPSDADTPLTTEQEAEWRAYQTRPNDDGVNGYRWTDADVNRIWATLDATRATPLSDEQWNEAYRAGRAAGITEVIDSQPATASIDVAWEEVEKALPEGAWLMSVEHTFAWEDTDDRLVPSDWLARAQLRTSGTWEFIGTGPTPAAALHALAARLSSAKDPAPDQHPEDPPEHPDDTRMREEVRE